MRLHVWNGEHTEILISVCCLVRLRILIHWTVVHVLVLSVRPVQTLLQPFEEPSVIVCASRASLPRRLLTHQVIGPDTAIVNLLRFDVVFAVELKERALLLGSLSKSSVLHHDLVVRRLGTIVLLPVRDILLRLSAIKICSFSHDRRSIDILLAIHHLILPDLVPLFI